VQDLKKNNQGYTLVELLVALAILAIVIVPFLHGFVVSAQVNSKAKKVLRATTAGTNVMELLKSESMEKLLEETYETTDADGNAVTLKALSYDDTNKVYNFTFTDQTVDGTAFRVEGTLDPTIYTNVDTNPDTDDGFNDAQDIIYDMNSANNAFVVQSTGMNSECANSLTSVSGQFDQITRTITIDIKNNGTTSTVFATIAYTDGSSTVYGMKNQCVFSSAGSDEELENVYLIYEPGFGSGSGGQMKEYIEINNEDNYPVQVFLIKQADESVSVYDESLYHVNIAVKEDNRSDSDYFDADGSFHVVTQLRTNVDESKISLEFLPHVTNGIDTTPAKTAVGLKNLVSGDAEERLYRVTLKVFEQDDGTGEVLYEMQGTKEK
jgi:prepilin-type N-terminal cleavage/methylation domain-containing protein